MKTKSFFCVIFFSSYLLQAYHSSVQDSSLLKKITQKLQNYTKLEGPEKTYLHTDKDIYRPGDTLWFKTYLVDGITHKKSEKSRVAYVELLNSEDSLLAKRILYIEGTSSFGSIELPRNLTENNYKLRTYTRYMLNDKERPFYQKGAAISGKKATSIERNTEEKADSENSINSSNQSINPSSKGIRVKFFPEGGNLVSGLSGGLAFKTSNFADYPISIKGNIIDSEGKVVADLDSNNFGLGIVYFIPEPGNSYYALVEYKGFEQKFEIPSILTKGFSLSIKNLGSNIIIQVETTEENVLDGTLLIGHLRGKQIFERLEKVNASKSYAVKLSTKDLPDGVANFTLFTSKGRPVSERLVFIDHPDNDSRVSMQTDSNSFGTREKVQLNVSILNSNGKPVKGDFSIRVSSTMSITRKSDMKNWLLLNTDLGVSVSDPELFFKDDSNETKLFRDALMLANEWDKFSWKGLLDGDTNTNLSGPEKGIMIRGTARNGNSPQKSTISLNILSEAFEEKYLLDEKGNFSFGPYLFNGNITAILQMVNDSKKSRGKETKINLDSQWPHISPKPNYNKNNQMKMVDLKTAKSKVSDFREISSEEYESNITFLDEVVVKEKRKTKSELIEDEINSFTSYGRPDKRIFRDSVKGWEGLSAMDLLERRGFRVTGSFPNQSISLYGGAPGSLNNRTSPLVLLDGTPTNGILGTLRASEVLFIDVLRFASASLYGTRGSQGVIAIYTHRTLRSADSGRTSDANITSAEIMGFNKKLDFYLPDYSGPNRFNILKDYRNTLFWNPDIELDEQGQGNFQFYTGDRTGQFTVELEGITEDGEIVHSNYDFKVDGKK